MKINLTDIANLDNENSVVAAINNNNQTLETALENTLSRDGTSPNQMGATLDMNSNRIINLSAPVNPHDAARLADVVGGSGGSSISLTTIGTSGAATLNSGILNIPTPPSYTAGTNINITTGVIALSGNIPVTNFNGGSGASTTTYLRGDGTWATPAGGGGGTPAGSNTQVQYNNAGAFGAITGATTNGTIMTLTSPAITTPTGIVPSDLNFTQTGTGAVARTVDSKLRDEVWITDFGASTGASATANSTAINAALATGKNVRAPAGTFTINASLLISVSNTRFIGAGRNQTIFTTANTNSSIINIASNVGNIEIADMGLTRSSTAVLGGNGVYFNGYVDTSCVRNLEIQKQFVGIALNATGYSEADRLFVHDNLNDGITFTNTAANGNIQWYIRNSLIQCNAGRGLIVVSANGPASVTLGTWTNVYTFANTSFGAAFVGGTGIGGNPPPINGVRIFGGFYGSDGNSELYLDTYGGQHKIDGAFTELAGRIATGPAFGTAASSVGSGVQITANNLDVTITDLTANGNFDYGLRTLATQVTSISGSSFQNNSAFGCLIGDGTKATLTNSAFNNNTSGNISVTSNSSKLLSNGNFPFNLNQNVINADTFNGSGSGTTIVQASSAASGTLTLPAATDTLVGKATTDTLTNKTFNSTGTGNVLQVSGVTVSAGQYPGETTTGNATAGNVGEYLQSVIATGSAVAVATTNTPQNITGMTITLTAGDWDVDMQAVLYDTASTVLHNYDTVSISTTTGTIDTTLGRFASRYGSASNIQNNVLPATGGVTLAIPPIRFSVSGNTQLFATVQCGWSGGGTPTVFGILRARRAR